MVAIIIIIIIINVVLTIVIFTSMLAIELFHITQLCSFIGCFFGYLPLFIPLQVYGVYLTRFKAQAYRAYMARNICQIVVRHVELPSLHNLFSTWQEKLCVYLWL